MAHHLCPLISFGSSPGQPNTLITFHLSWVRPWTHPHPLTWISRNAQTTLPRLYGKSDGSLVTSTERWLWLPGVLRMLKHVPRHTSKERKIKQQEKVFPMWSSTRLHFLSCINSDRESNKTRPRSNRYTCYLKQKSIQWNLSIIHLKKSFKGLWNTWYTTIHAQLCPTLCDPLDCSPPGSSVHGISQARILEWVVISFSRVSSQPRNRTHTSCISCTAGGFFYLLSHQGSLNAWQYVKFIGESEVK